MARLAREAIGAQLFIAPEFLTELDELGPERAGNLFRVYSALRSTRIPCSTGVLDGTRVLGLGLKDRGFRISR